MKQPEIMAPVGGEEQLKAAVRLGADDVYFGMQNFNARRNADNFAGEGLADTIAYCHSHGTKVYLTLNTLIMDEELEDMKKAVDTAAMAGADAIIVQDLAVAAYAHKTWPQLPLHASTQMAICNCAGVRELERYGFSRVVVARELSLKEIEKIHKETGVEIEVFVHGAHCMSVSGNCYLSAMIGGRSGNRGLCAQPCRLNWELNGKDHALSLKDLSYITHIRELATAGVSAIKIEGRMKRAEYVAAAVTACQDALAGRTPDLDTLQAVFSRSGFTDGYLTGERGPHMFGFRTKEDVLAAGTVLQSLAETYAKEPQTVGVDMYLYVPEAGPSQLTVTDGEHTVVVDGAEAQKARTLPISEEYARRSLEKTGGSMYYLRDFTLYAEEGLMLPSSALNELRRTALQQMTEERTVCPNYKKQEQTEAADASEEGLYLPEYVPGPFEYRYRFEHANQIPATLKDGTIILPIRELENNPQLIERWKDHLMAELPAVIYPETEASLQQRLTALAQLGVAHAYTENISGISLIRDAGMSVHGGADLNILNSESMEEYHMLGIVDSVVSFELAFSKARKLKGTLPRGYVVYGYLPLMKLRSCPAKGEKGCGSCNGQNLLTDRMGEKFPMVCREKQYTELLNCVPLYLGDKSVPRADFHLLYFTIENSLECSRIIKMYKENAAPDFRRTGGLYFRELQ